MSAMVPPTPETFSHAGIADAFTILANEAQSAAFDQFGGFVVPGQYNGDLSHALSGTAEWRAGSQLFSVFRSNYGSRLMLRLSSCERGIERWESITHDTSLETRQTVLHWAANAVIVRQHKLPSTGLAGPIDHANKNLAAATSPPNYRCSLDQLANLCLGNGSSVPKPDLRRAALETAEAFVENRANELLDIFWSTYTIPQQKWYSRLFVAMKSAKSDSL